MRKFDILLAFIILSSFFGCGKNPDPSSGDSSSQELGPKKQARPLLQESPLPVANKWLSEKAWGEPTEAIDFLNDKSLLNDDRVSQVYKTQIPGICEEYVLWRVEHDGSCWVSSAITQLIFQMIEAGEAKFDEVIAHFRSIFAEEKLLGRAQDQEIIKDFFGILELLREKMDHRFSLTLRNHTFVYQTLDRGFRTLLASWMRQNDLDYLTATIERPNSWGNSSNFHGIFQKLGFRYGGISSDGAFGGAPMTKSFFELSDYVTPVELASIRQGDPQKRRDLIRKKMPLVMSFRSSPGFVDVAVLKSVAEKIRKHGS